MSSPGNSKPPKTTLQATPKDVSDVLKSYNELAPGKEYDVSFYMHTTYSQKPNVKYMKYYGIIYPRGLDGDEANRQAVFKTDERVRTADVEGAVKDKLNEFIESAGNAAPMQTRSKAGSRGGRK